VIDIKSMPELPEVETIARDLRKKIKGEVITSFWSDWKKGIRGGYVDFARGVKGRKILDIGRFGKNLMLWLSGGRVMLVHLRMTGKLILRRAMPGAKRDKHVHHIFYFRSGKILEFSDVRKFGSLELRRSQASAQGSLKNLGTDVLSDGFTLEKFDDILNGSKAKIKQLLMDQRKMAGLGNIYASEILFRAGISPLRKAHSLTRSERKKTHQAIKDILKKAVEMRGTSISDYRDASGRRGAFQRVLAVYGRAGKSCSHCGTIISREVIGQRGTFFCKSCQK